jgi:menaquinone-specific isochorismate synthase
VEKEWQDFLAEALTYNPFLENGIGPLIFGGFSFDPYKQKTELWSNFSHSQFHVPTFMLSVIKGQAFITTNIVCTPDDNWTLFQKTAVEQDELFKSLAQNIDTNSAKLLETKAISPQRWKETVDEVVNDLNNGGLKKVVLARELRLQFDDYVASEAVLSRLFKEQHDSFIFGFESNGDCFIGASPERLVKKQGDNVFSTCLAGSIPRGKT